MALPTYLVELQFGSSGYVDVSAYVQSISSNRGISRALDDFSAGTLSVTFVNNARIFDPLNTSSILYYTTGGYTMVQPGGKIRVSANSIRRFTGFIQSWDFSYDEAGLDGKATVSALDQMFQIGNISFTGGTQYVVESSSDRIKRVMAANGFVAGDYAKIESTQTPIGGDVNNAGDNVLSYLQNVARSEPGDFFSNASAVMTFKDRSFTNYTWSNTTRQNLIKFQGTATVNAGTTSSTYSGWNTGNNIGSTPPAGLLFTENVWYAPGTAGVTPNILYIDVNGSAINPTGTATQYVISGYFTGVGVTSANVFSFIGSLLDSTGGTISSGTVLGSTAVGLSALTWNRFNVALTASTGVVAGLSLQGISGATGVPERIYGAGFLAETGTALNAYFDGIYNPNLSDASNRYDVAWLGTGLASASGMIISTASTAAAPAIYTFADQNSQGASYGNGTGIPFTDLTVVYGGEQLYNQVQVVGVNSTALVTDSAGQTRYGIRAYAQTDNLTTSVQAPARIAAGLLGEFRLPEYRANEITVALEALTQAQQTIVLSLEIRDVVRVCFQPSATGSVIDKYYQVLGATSDIDVERHHITLTLASIDNLPIRLDSTLLAILDTDTIA
jgi:hypothetical protein